MTRPLPQRKFYSLTDLEARWKIPSSDILQWLIHGELRAHVWLPLMSVYELIETIDGNRVQIFKELRHVDGYVLLPPHSHRRLARQGGLELTHFCSTNGLHQYALPETTPGYPVGIEDLVILNEERERFERGYHMEVTSDHHPPPLSEKVSSPANQSLHLSTQDFRNVTYDGQHHLLGSIQATVLHRLYEAARNGSPWINGKQLLASAGSQSFNVANIFKRKPIWRKFITSDGRGNYRLDVEFLSSLKEHQ